MPTRSPLSKADYRAVARLHIDNLDQSFLATLGTGFLSELYRAMDRANDCALIIERNRAGQITGFVTGGQSMGPIYKAMLPRCLIWGWGLGLRLLSPARMGRVIDILRYDGVDGFSDIPAELFSIAVDPSGRGQGVAPRLYNALVAFFTTRGIDRFRIIVGGDLAAAHGFYLKMGAEVAGEITLHAGEVSTVYIHKNKAVSGA